MLVVQFITYAPLVTIFVLLTVSVGILAETAVFRNQRGDAGHSGQAAPTGVLGWAGLGSARLGSAGRGGAGLGSAGLGLARLGSGRSDQGPEANSVTRPTAGLH